MFAVRIKNLRLTKGLNQVQLADKLGVKKQSISNWENDCWRREIATIFCREYLTNFCRKSRSQQNK